MNPQDFYTTHGIMTDPAEYGSLFDPLPDDIPSLCKIAQNLIIHSEDLQRYGVDFPRERIEHDSNLLKVSRILRRILELNDAPLSVTRPPENRVVGNCRDFSTLLTAVLRHKRIPARVRVGFCTYLQPDVYTNHFICQYWNSNEKRWIWVDAMIDDVLRNGYDINIGTYDMPEGPFLPGGDCWQMCRNGIFDPDLFWYFQDMYGMPYILGNMVRDLLSLNKIELVPWDRWDIMDKQQEISPEDMDLMDRVASVTKGTEPEISGVRSIYEEEERLQLPVFLEEYFAKI